jgi:hypothetical protein
MNGSLKEDSEFGQDALAGQSTSTKEDEWSASGSAGSPDQQGRIQYCKPGYPTGVGFLGKASVARWLEEGGQKVR